MGQKAKGVLVTIAVIFIFIMLFIIAIFVLDAIIPDDYYEDTPIEFDSDFPSKSKDQYFKSEDDALKLTLNGATYIF